MQSIIQIDKALSQAEVSLQKAKSRPDSIVSLVRKAEPLPNFLRNDNYLAERYNSKDLEFTYVYAQCKKLKVLKGVEVTDDQIEFWFKEFLSKGWSKNYFDKRLEAVKMAKIYGSFIDINIWYESEVLYSEYEANILAEEIIKRKIQKAETMKLEGIKLTEEQEQFCQYAAAQNFMQTCERERLEKRDEIIQKLQADLRRQLKTKKTAIINLPQVSKIYLLDEIINRGIIKCNKSGFEYSATLSTLEYLADKIPDELLEEVINNSHD